MGYRRLSKEEEEEIPALLQAPETQEKKKWGQGLRGGEAIYPGQTAASSIQKDPATC